jgi:hypothetical protein
VASARKIAANRQNAAKSTGPRSDAAKARTRRNAARHGLAARLLWDADDTARIERHARDIAPDARDFVTINAARAIARAVLDLERIRALKVGLINAAILPLRTAEQIDMPTDPPADMLAKLLADPTTGMPMGAPTELQIALARASQPDHAADHPAVAIRRVLPQLVKLERYERQAAARRDRAVRDLLRAAGTG